MALIYSSYKDDPRLNPELTQMVGTALADCNKDELEALCSPISGIAVQCSWPPVLYDIAKFRKERRDKLAAKADFDGRYPRRIERVMLPGKREPFRPYPKLWAAFAGEPEIIERLDNRPQWPLMNFDQLTEASRLLATRGIDEARRYILGDPMPEPGTPDHLEWQEAQDAMAEAPAFGSRQ